MFCFDGNTRFVRRFLGTSRVDGFEESVQTFLEEGVEGEEGEDEVAITINMAENKNMLTPGDKVFFRTDTGMEEPMKVVKVRRMLGTNFLAATVADMDGTIVGEYDDTQLVKFPEKKFFNPEEKANVFVRELEGEVQTENKLLKASNTLEDALNKVVDDLTDEQIDRFTNMILDLRDKVKAQRK